MTVHDEANSDGDSVRASTSATVTNTPRRSFRRSTRRPTTGRLSASSLVQQRLQSAIQSGERSTADLLHVQSSFRARGVAAAEKAETDRSVSRYRNDAAIVSFCDPPSSSTSATSMGFCYSNNFMPGVHFYTFLASRDANVTGAQALDPADPTAVAGPLNDNDDDERPSVVSKTPPGLRLWIPDTVVYGETGRAVLIYTDENGIVQRSSDVTDKMVIERLAVSSAGDLDPIVVCKEPTLMPAKKIDGNALAYQGNLLRLLSPGELKTVLSNVSSSTKSFALQNFVRCNGSKAFVVRAVYEAGKPPYAWMINNTTPMAAPNPTVSQVLLSLGQDASTAGPTLARSGSLAGSTCTVGSSSTITESDASAAPNGPATSRQPIATVPLVNRVCTSVQVDKACTFIKLSERGCTSVAELNKRLVQFIERRLRIQLQTLVADFTKDADGRWWLLQVKHFRVRPSTATAKVCYSLPRRLRTLYLGYRDSSIVEETADSDEEYDKQRRAAQAAAQMTQRQVQKLTQCKCCLAAYPKRELAFKMTLKMINEMLARIRSRLPPEKSYTFLTAALARESPDTSLAYESWSVCSYCYAIYERDQQLQKVETKFADILGVPDVNVMLAGLGKLEDRPVMVDPTATSTVLPAHLTLCRLMLVVNGIYDIPPELYDAESHVTDAQGGDVSKRSSLRAPHTSASHLYLRIAAFGYTECIRVNPTDICISHERAPRGTRRRRTSTASTLDGSDSDDSEESEGVSGSPQHGREGRNYWLPIHLIRSIHFFAPRTPLHAKLKETSGLTPFLNEDNSISIQFIRATEPPLHDPLPVTVAIAERGRTRRTALQPQPLGSAFAAKPEAPKKSFPPLASNHSILLGATKLRMAQFRSAYVTKLDFYACMALTGEMFNIKGNLGLERVRYVDTKLLTSRYRLRAYNGVYIPDASYLPSDPLTSEWMDCLRAAAIPVPYTHGNDTGEETQQSDGRPNTRRDTQSSVELQRGGRIGQSGSITSLSADNDDMDEELEHMIEHASGEQTPSGPKPPNGVLPSPSANKAPPKMDVPAMKQQLVPRATPSSHVDSQMTTLLNKPVLSPRSHPATHDARTHKSKLWSLNIQLNHIHNLQSRERPFCRWECYYELFGQRRSAVERSSTTRHGSPLNKESEIPSKENGSEDPPPTMTEVVFSCTHRFFLAATRSLVASHIRSNPTITMHLRNDVYSSTRSKSAGEFFCKLDLSGLMNSREVDATLDVVAASTTPLLTPREAALVSRHPPFLSLSVQLSELTVDPEACVADGEFVLVGLTEDGIQVLKKVT